MSLQKLSKLENQIIAYYFHKNIDILIEFIKNKDNFLNLISCYAVESPNSIRNYMKMDSLILLVKYYQRQQHSLNENTLKDFLLTYFTYEVKNYQLWNEAFKQVVNNLSDDDITHLYIEKNIIDKYQELLSASIIDDILSKVIINGTLIQNAPKNTIDIDLILKKFYKKVSQNSFNLAFDKFRLYSTSIIPGYIDNEFYTDFINYSKQAIIEVKTYYNYLFKESMFESKLYNTQAKLKWVPILERSLIVDDKEVLVIRG